MTSKREIKGWVKAFWICVSLSIIGKLLSVVSAIWIAISYAEYLFKDKTFDNRSLWALGISLVIWKFLSLSAVACASILKREKESFPDNYPKASSKWQNRLEQMRKAQQELANKK